MPLEAVPEEIEDGFLALLAGGLIVFPVSTGGVRAFRAADGGEAWKRDLGSLLSGGLLSAGGLVIVPVTDGRVVALKEADGTDAWTARLTAPAYGTPVSDGRGGVLLGTEGSTVERLPGTGGAATWTARVDSPVHSRPLVIGGTVYAVTTRGTVVRIGAADGKITGTTPLGLGVEGDATEHGRMLYIAAAGGSLVAYGLETNQVLWKRSGLGNLQAAPAVSGEILVAASADASGAVVGLKP